MPRGRNDVEEGTIRNRWDGIERRLSVDDMDIEADEEDEDDEMDVEVDEEAEEEHPAPAYPVVGLLNKLTARLLEDYYSRASTCTAWSDSEVARLLAISSPPASPLSPWSSSPPQIPFPLSPPSPVLSAPPPSPIRSLGYRAAMIRYDEAEAATTSHSLPLPPPFILSPTRPDAPPPMPTSAPTSLPPLLLPSASRREDRPEVNLPPRKRLGIALGPRYEVGESSAAAAARPAGGLRADYGFVATMDREIRRDPERYVGYGITDSWDEIVETLQGAPVSTDTELGAHMREFESMVRRDTDEIYTMLDDEQSQRQLLAGRVMSTYAHSSMHRCCDHKSFTSVDRSRQGAISDLLRQTARRPVRTGCDFKDAEGRPEEICRDERGQVAVLQGQVTALQGQQGPAGGPAQPELPEEAGSSS
ncbi:hypothetical protein Tco_0594150 [Tanacetum coccineum]